MKPESIFVKCECCCNVIEINSEKYSNEEATFNIAVWTQHSGNSPMSKKERIRWCDHVMKTGKPWADHTIVTQKEAQRIVQFLTEKLTQYGKTKPAGK